MISEHELSKAASSISWPVLTAIVTFFVTALTSAFGIGRSQQKTQSMINNLGDKVDGLIVSQKSHRLETAENAKNLAHLTGRVDAKGD